MFRNTIIRKWSLSNTSTSIISFQKKQRMQMFTPSFSISSASRPSSSVLEEIQKSLELPLRKLFPQVSGLSPLIARATVDSAHYQCNNAFSLAKQLNQDSREVAERIASAICSADFIERAEVTGKGFVAIRLKQEYIGKRLLTCSELIPTAKPKRVLVDYASPNMSKALHVGHMRTILIGDCVARLLERLGHSVDRISHVGDFGTPIATVLTHLFETRAGDWKEWLRKASAEDLSDLYLQAKRRADQCEELRAQKRKEPENQQPTKEKEQISRVSVVLEFPEKEGQPDFLSRVSALLSQMQRDISGYRKNNGTVSKEFSQAFVGWVELCESSRRGYMPLMKLLGVSEKLREQGESYYVNMLESVVTELLEKKIAVLDDVAVVVSLKQADLEKNPSTAAFHSTEEKKETKKDTKKEAKKDKGAAELSATTSGDVHKKRKAKDDVVSVLIRKGDGTHLYSTTDLAALSERCKANDWLIYVVDRSQKIHLASVFEIGRRANWFTPQARIDHLDFGVVQGEDGKKLSSRDGNAAPLQMLVDRAIDEAYKVLHAADTMLGAEITSNVTPENIRTTSPVRAGASIMTPRTAEQTAADARALGISSLKYFELAQHYSSNYVFSLPRMMAFKGNTVVYLNDAYSRIRSIDKQLVAKAVDTKNLSHARTDDPSVFRLEHPTEISLAIKLIQFQEAVQSFEHTLAPSQLCQYLYDLSAKFHTFYENCRVVGSPQQESRVALCNATRLVLLQGMDLLGVKPIERM